MLASSLCHHFDAHRCRSCGWLDVAYPAQLAEKQAAVEELLAPVTSPLPGSIWLPPVPSPQLGFRNKAKMVVSGTVEAPVLGILGPSGTGVDLRDCPLHLPGIQAALPVLAGFVTRAALTPYDVGARRGELKHLLVTESPDGELMVRFVLRSQEPVARLRKHLPSLLAELPSVAVASVNLQPEHKAVIEGEREILLTDRATLTMRVAGLALHLRPQSFFQTNTAMATELYARARAWVADLAPRTAWDLYCGVGGFALAISDTVGAVTGIEVSAEAVASATQSAADAGLASARFEAGDATAFALRQDAPVDGPELVVVNPPRRGIGPELSGWLEASDVPHVLYSSCHAQSLARDLAAMPSLRPVRAQVLDMFPNTDHYEVLTLLDRS